MNHEKIHIFQQSKYIENGNVLHSNMDGLNYNSNNPYVEVVSQTNGNIHYKKINISDLFQRKYGEKSILERLEKDFDMVKKTNKTKRKNNRKTRRKKRSKTNKSKTKSRSKSKTKSKK